ncbi:hypothetical protein B0T17DRAFT_603579 [Bombardia bombarda]|uniref:Uncharacterized protein n=1 Tax=Bombardia bombarda TaxID=252184 RepID=A0AA39WCA3_9PEZI|nr:hypothetical protein B0T17DRAFT_603579 [Bombardia bombarda]
MDILVTGKCLALLCLIAWCIGPLADRVVWQVVDYLGQSGRNAEFSTIYGRCNLNLTSSWWVVNIPELNSPVLERRQEALDVSHECPYSIDAMVPTGRSDLETGKDVVGHFGKEALHSRRQTDAGAYSSPMVWSTTRHVCLGKSGSTSTIQVVLSMLGPPLRNGPSSAIRNNMACNHVCHKHGDKHLLYGEADGTVGIELGTSALLPPTSVLASPDYAEADFDCGVP